MNNGATHEGDVEIIYIYHCVKVGKLFIDPPQVSVMVVTLNISLSYFVGLEEPKLFHGSRERTPSVTFYIETVCCDNTI